MGIVFEMKCVSMWYWPIKSAGNPKWSKLNQNWQRQFQFWAKHVTCLITRLLLFSSLILPFLSYSVEVWGNAYKKQLTTTVIYSIRIAHNLHFREQALFGSKHKNYGMWLNIKQFLRLKQKSVYFLETFNKCLVRRRGGTI